MRTKTDDVANIQVPIDDPKRFRIEMTFSRGADLSPLEVIIFFLSIYPRKG